MLHVHLAEDHLALREAMRLLFQAQGWRVTLSSAVDDTLAALAVERPDVLVSDLHLDGLGTVDEILQAQSNLPPTLVLTGNEDRSLHDRLRAMGAHDVLLKPVSFHRLLDAVRGTLPALPALEA